MEQRMAGWPLSPKDFAKKCLESATDECIVGVFTHNRVRVYDGTRPRGKKMVGLREFVCLRALGPPSSNGMVPYVNNMVCNDPDCYNPRHLTWMEIGSAALLGRTYTGMRSRALSPNDVITGPWIYGRDGTIVLRDGD